MSVNNIEIYFEDFTPFEITPFKFEEYIQKLIKSEQKICGEISIIFCSDAYLLDINKKFLNHDYFTDIITFDYVENSLISGDLFISIDRIKENSEHFEMGFVKELYRVVFHGILHLIGYNDKLDREKQQMREKENFYLEWVEEINHDFKI